MCLCHDKINQRSCTLHFKGPTASSETGPSAAYTGSQYAYIEASSPREAGDRALLKTTNLFKGMVSFLFFLSQMGRCYMQKCIPTKINARHKTL